LKTYVALLRGINVSGQNKVSMADLRTLFLNLGAEDVTTYVQSGNVVFKSAAGSSAELTRAIEMRIRRDLGLRSLCSAARTETPSTSSRRVKR